jgi:hypothetical protein
VTGQRAFRRDLDTARLAGLAARHAAKLARIEEENVPELPPCCAEADGDVCPQHAQHARATRYDGLRNRSARGQAVVGEPGKAKPSPEEKP